MKKTILGIIVVVIAAVAAWNVNVIAKSQTEGTVYHLFANSEALAQGEGSGGSLYNIDEEDCSITLTGETGVTVKVWGVSYTFPVSGRLTLTFSDVKIQCSSGGYNQCEWSSCADFWKDC
jgi:hypothetical protein